MSFSLSNCPQCEKAVSKKAVSENLKYNNDQGIVIFACSNCNEHLKFSPYEYLEAKKSGGTVQLYKESGVLKSEKMADSDYDWAGYPKRLAIGLVLFAFIYFVLD